MGKKRNLLEEIQSIKNRSYTKELRRNLIPIYQVESTLNEILKEKKNFNELLKYIPISIVACYESYFRGAVCELIDKGDPYSSRIAKYNQSQNIKIDFEVLGAVQTKTLTVGEFVSHLLPFSSLEDILSNINILLDGDFVQHLVTFDKVMIYNFSNKRIKDFKKRHGEILSSVKEAYQLRHAFCHEALYRVKLDPDHIKKIYTDCEIFIQQSNDLLDEIIHPNFPQTQRDMNILSQKEFEDSNNKLDNLIKKIKNYSTSKERVGYYKAEAFDECQKTWEKFRDQYVKYKASMVEGGSMYPTVFAMNKTRITTERINQLQSDFNNLLKEGIY